jgi:hypothetical protein
MLSPLPNHRAGLVATIALTMVVQNPLDERAAASFLEELQRSVARDDRAAVAALVRYPLTVLAGTVRIPIADAAALMQNYDVVFSPELRSLIARAAIPARGGSRPAVSVSITDVITIAVDVIRIERVGEALKITRISAPLGAPSAVSAPGSNRGNRNEVQRLILGVGRLQRSGALGPGERDAYVLWARKNQLLEIRINGVSGRAVVVRISSAKSGAPLDSRARDGARTWIGRIPEDGDYRIEVVRLAAGASLLPYVIAISGR